MQFNDAGLTLIKKFEGCELTAYQDVGGVWTIGYGHTGPEVVAGLIIMQSDAENYLSQDLQKFTTDVTNLLADITLNDNQFSALVSFAYNLGSDALGRSTLLKKIQQNDMTGAADQFLRWNCVNNVPVDGLTRRRQAERTLFLTPITNA